MDVSLRPFTRDDVAVLERFAVDPEATGPFNWAGFRNPRGPLERFEELGLLGDDAKHLVIVTNGAARGRHPHRSHGRGCRVIRHWPTITPPTIRGWPRCAR